MNRTGILKMILMAFLAVSPSGLHPAGNDQPASPHPANLAQAPRWVRELADKMQKEQSDGAAIYANQYHNQTVYYIPKPCCDQFDPLYDSQGNIICHPSGGFAGGGDHQCSDYSLEKQVEIFRVVHKQS